LSTPLFKREAMPALRRLLRFSSASCSPRFCILIADDSEPAPRGFKGRSALSIR
jgi:hypothetical protein